MFAEEEGSNLYNFLSKVGLAVAEFSTPADVDEKIEKAASERDKNIKYTTDLYQQRIDEISQSKDKELKRIEEWETRMKESGQSPSDIAIKVEPQYKRVERESNEALVRLTDEFNGSLEDSLAPIRAKYLATVAAIREAQRQASLGYQDVPPAA
jgi:hypothetical protein